MRVDEAKTWIGAVVLLIILAAIGVLILNELYGTVKPGVTTVNNATLTSAMDAPQLVVEGSDDWPAEFTVLHLVNGSDNSGDTGQVRYPENATNYHYNSTYGTITILSTINYGGGAEPDTTVFNISYTYQAGDTKSDTLKNGTLSISNVTKQLPTVGIIIGVLLIIGAVMLIARYFGRQYTA